jgi:hypothetical protein
MYFKYSYENVKQYDFLYIFDWSYAIKTFNVFIFFFFALNIQKHIRKYKYTHPYSY